jgi:Domain of unknown function (DUF6134)
VARAQQLPGEATVRTRRARRAGRVARAFAQAAICALFVLAFLAQAPALAASPVRLLYGVQHAIFGDIGTYSNTIAKKDGVTTVRTHAHFRVRLLGILLGGQEGRHVEQWVKNRLVYFHGITNKGNKRLEVIGKANGDKFIIHSALGTIVAPASVHPANPWSSNILDSHTMMRVDTGKLEKVSITGGEPTPVTLDGVAIPCREYKLMGHTNYWVWLDDAGVPVKFKVADDTGMVTFTLSHCNGCDRDGRYAERR